MVRRIAKRIASLEQAAPVDSQALEGQQWIELREVVHSSKLLRELLYATAREPPVDRLRAAELEAEIERVTICAAEEMGFDDLARALRKEG